MYWWQNNILSFSAKSLLVFKFFYSVHGAVNNRPDSQQNKNVHIRNRVSFSGVVLYWKYIHLLKCKTTNTIKHVIYIDYNNKKTVRRDKTLDYSFKINGIWKQLLFGVIYFKDRDKFIWRLEVQQLLPNMYLQIKIA